MKKPAKENEEAHPVMREESEESKVPEAKGRKCLQVSASDQFSSTKYLQSNASAAAAAKSLQSCPTLCDPIGDSPPGSAIPGIL